MHYDIDSASILIDEQHARPRLSTIGGSIDAAFLLWTIAVPLRSDEDDVRIGWIDGNAANSSTRFESHSLPCPAGVGGLVHAVANRDVDCG
jgi:hypothetical protein